MPFVSQNPYTEEILATYPELSEAEVKEKLDLAESVFNQWRWTNFVHRARLMKKAAEILRTKKKEFGKIITLEMGKPITGAAAEVEKCARVCDYYADNAEKFLAPELIETDASESYVRFDPIGAVLAIMPWNFPLWQVFRFAAPAIMAGNAGILKHASNVPQCAMAIESVFREAGFPAGVFQNFMISTSQVPAVIADQRVQAVTLTGSEGAGMAVAYAAGREIKKTVLELGGSDPFIVLADTDLEKSCETAVTARLQNAGQSCIAAKRFIVASEIADEFVDRLKEKYESLKIGDPMDEKTAVGPLATAKIRDDIAKQVEQSVEAGAKVVTGGRRKEGRGFFYEPTILTNVKKGMPAYHEETFGPVASVIVVQDADEAVHVANDTSFGLGASLWTKDLDLAKKLASRIEAGCVFVNGMVKSDPRLPFGGIKRSGYGRELSHYGIREFVNIKTVWIA